jgi:hypothetical protein
MNRYWQTSKPVPITNFFEGLEEQFDEINTKVRMEKTVKSPPIVVAGIVNFLSFSQLLKEIAIGEYEIKIMNNKEVKIQPKSSIAYVK